MSNWFLQQDDVARGNKRNPSFVDGGDNAPFFNDNITNYSDFVDGENKDNDTNMYGVDVKKAIDVGNELMASAIKEDDYEDENRMEGEEWGQQVSYFDPDYLTDNQDLVLDSTNSYLKELSRYNHVKKVKVQNLLEGNSVGIIGKTI
jgi:hypothetical protein